MDGNMVIVTKEMIKPSSPTPNHLRNFKLSFLDQIAPPIYTPLIFFYQASQLHGGDDHHHNHAKISQLLKQSLSKSLSLFYPLAGRINDGFFLECNDAGALFVEAKVHSDLSQIVDKPNMDELREYLPLEPMTGRGGAIDEKDQNALLAIQVNFFDCGGIAIAVEMSHKIADGTSLVTFMNAWASICREDENIPESNFGMSNLFPPKDLFTFGFMSSTGITKEKIVTKRILFSKEDLIKLKENVSLAPGSTVKDPTRVEALSAFIWRHFMETRKGKMGTKQKIVAALHAVNLRPRMDPPLLDRAFGNLWRHTMAIPLMSKEENDYHNLVGNLRSSIRSINNDYVKKVQNGDEYIPILKKSVEIFTKGEIELCNFSSWCRFPVYEVDFGWEKPIWVCTTTLPFKNVAILMSTKNGDGIEAWINMLEEDASFFEGGLLGVNSHSF